MRISMILGGIIAGLIIVVCLLHKRILELSETNKMLKAQNCYYRQKLIAAGLM